MRPHQSTSRRTDASTGSSGWVIYGAIAANAGIAAAKYVAAAFTGSSAMISEGIHSTVDTGDSLLLLLGKHRSQRPPDELHPYGHGKELYFWTLLVAMIIFGGGGGMSIYEGITHLLNPAPLEDPTWNYWTLGIAAVLELSSFTIAFREFLHAKPPGRGLWQAVRRGKDPTVFTVVFEDSAALLGLVVAFLGVFLGHRLGNPSLDGIASLAIGAILAVVAVLLAYESRGLLVGESADIGVVRSVRNLAESDPAVEHVGPPLTMQLGPDQVLLNVEARFRPSLSLDELEAAIARMEQRIRSEHPQITRIFIEAESLHRDGGPKPP